MSRKNKILTEAEISSFCQQINMIVKDGTTIPKVPKNAPQNPATRYPTNVEELIAIGPGVDSAITVTSESSSVVIHFFLSTHSWSIIDIIA